MESKQYTRDEVHMLMCKAFEQAFKKANVVEAGLEGLATDVECAWILTRYDSTPENKKGKTYTEEDIVKAIMHGAKAERGEIDLDGDWIDEFILTLNQ